MLYQARRKFGDYVNGIEIPYGGYVETDCIKWVERIGPFLRPLSPGEKPKGKVIAVKNTIEDAVVEIAITSEVKEDPIITEDVVKSEVTEEPVVEATPLRRKIKPLRNN
jgi:hypothetical protein